jgi:hypothetical protein
MDICFELLLNDSKPLAKLVTQQKSITWGGIKYPQEPIYYFWGDYIKLYETPVPRHIYRFLPKTYQKNHLQCFSIQGKVLELLEKEESGIEVEWGEYNLDSLLEYVLYSQEIWAIVFSLHCDEIDSVYTLDINEAIKRIRDNMHAQEDREGFVIFSKARKVN